jgi:hypothetical protein
LDRDEEQKKNSTTDSTKKNSDYRYHKPKTAAAVIPRSRHTINKKILDHRNAGFINQPELMDAEK